MQDDQLNQLSETLTSASAAVADSTTLADEQKNDTDVVPGSIKAEPPTYQRHLDFWQREDLDADELLRPVSTACFDELVEFGNGDRDSAPESRRFIREVMSTLQEDGPGMAILSELPSEGIGMLAHQRICTVLSSEVAALKAQDRAGTLLYDVRNKHVANPQAVRKSITNLAQPYHTDGGWFDPTAEYIGLYCIQNAREGGSSEATSLLAAFAQMQASEPAAIAALKGALPWDKQGEYLEGESPFCHLPVFEHIEGRFLGRYYESYITSGYTLTGTPMPTAVKHALEVLKKTLAQQPRLGFRLKAGQMQLVNNRTLVHARAAFRGSPSNPATAAKAPITSGRHLIRVWMGG